VEEAGVPIYGAGGSLGFTDAANASAGDIVVGRVGSVGSLRLLASEAWATDNTLVVSLDLMRVEPRFAIYALREISIAEITSGTAMPLVTGSKLLRQSIPLPPIDQQRAIAGYLDRETARIDTLISEQQRLIDMLRERRRVLATRAVCFGVDEEIELRDSNDPVVGLVPAHWTVKSVRHWLESLDARRIPLSAEERGDRRGTFDYYGASGVIDHVDDYLFDEPLVLVSEDGANLLMRSTPIAFAAKGKYWVNNHAHVLRPLAGGDVDYWAQRLEAVDVRTVVSGSAQPKLTAGALQALRISAPEDPEEQRKIAAYVDEHTAKIDNMIQETKRFVELSEERRAALITAAVTGLIDVEAVA